MNPCGWKHATLPFTVTTSPHMSHGALPPSLHLNLMVPPLVAAPLASTSSLLCFCCCFSSWFCVFKSKSVFSFSLRFCWNSVITCSLVCSCCLSCWMSCWPATMAASFCCSWWSLPASSFSLPANCSSLIVSCCWSFSSWSLVAVRRLCNPRIRCCRWWLSCSFFFAAAQLECAADYLWCWAVVEDLESAVIVVFLSLYFLCGHFVLVWYSHETAAHS